MKNFFFFFLVSFVPVGGARVPARHAKMPWLELCYPTSDMSRGSTLLEPQLWNHQQKKG
jgi:hypothetical protein